MGSRTDIYPAKDAFMLPRISAMAAPPGKKNLPRKAARS
jgi:hypothetical protein